MKLVEYDNLRGHIFKRLQELNMKDSELLKDLEERGCVIVASRWSKYKRNAKGQITDEQLVFVATRLDIPIHVNFGTPVFKDGKIIFEQLKFDELRALTRLKALFPNGVK